MKTLIFVWLLDELPTIVTNILKIGFWLPGVAYHGEIDSPQYIPGRFLRKFWLTRQNLWAKIINILTHWSMVNGHGPREVRKSCWKVPLNRIRKSHMTCQGMMPHPGDIDLPAGLGICSLVSQANRSFFPQKWANERFAQKTERFTHSLIFGERPKQFALDCSFPLSNLSELLMVAHFWWATWAIRSHYSFLVSDLSHSLTSLTKKEGMSNSLIFYLNKNHI